MNGDFDVSHFGVWTGRVINVLSYPVVSMRRHAFVKHAGLELEHNVQTFDLTKAHAVYAQQRQLGERINAPLGDHCFDSIQRVMCDSLFHDIDFMESINFSQADA